MFFLSQCYVPFLITCIHVYKVGADDGHEELLAAANAVTNTGIVRFVVLILSYCILFSWQ